VETALSVNIELLLRVCVIGRDMGCSWKGRLKKLAFDAVIGVLGVLGALYLGGGLSGAEDETATGSRSRKALILVATGPLKGIKFSGGSFNGWRFFRLKLTGCCFP
jgi:hypothetical protein